MTPAQAFAALRRMPPEQALEFLRARGLITQTWSWADLSAEEFAVQFTVSRLAAIDVLADLQALIISSVDGDLNRTDFVNDAKTLLQRRGWWGIKDVQDPATGEMVTTTFNPARLKLIYDTNVRQAAVAGQWERAMATKFALPYGRYVTKSDGKVRDEHAAWHNVVLPLDDPWWSTHMPLNGYRCRCSFVQVSERKYNLGLSPRGEPFKKTAPPVKLSEWDNPRTGETLQVPQGIHPAFVGNPGIDRLKGLQRLQREKLAIFKQGAPK